MAVVANEIALATVELSTTPEETRSVDDPFRFPLNETMDEAFAFTPAPSGMVSGADGGIAELMTF